MKSTFHQRCYNGLILPLLWGGSHILSLFNAKIRIGLNSREGLIARAIDFRKRMGNRPVILFHCASAGELEALKPIAGFMDRNRAAIAVSYFSPSARSALKNNSEFDFADFSPLDRKAIVEDYLDALNPAVIAITKHDVWPNFVWEAKRREIPLLLINGNFHAKSTKRWPMVKQFSRAVHESFTRIMTVSDEDSENARQIVGNTVPVISVGDARYDRVLFRIEQRNPLPNVVEDVSQRRTILIAGSTHPDDEELLLPVIPRLISAIPEFLVVIVPHDPSLKARKRILANCSSYGLRCCDLDDGQVNESTAVLLINRTGLLADLYRIGKIAYVGGGFGKGVHSVLEPMAAGLPVLCGPNIHVSNEARMAASEGFFRVVTGRRQVEQHITNWLSDPANIDSLRRQSLDFIRMQTGASQKIADALMMYIHE